MPACDKLFVDSFDAEIAIEMQMYSFRVNVISRSLRK